MAVRVLNMTDDPCPQCGKPGSVNGGRCLDCAIENTKGENQMISGGIIKKVCVMVEDLLTVHKREMSEAIMEDEDGVLKVTFSVKFERKSGGLLVDTGISFTMGKVKDGQQIFLDEKQLGLF